MAQEMEKITDQLKYNQKILSSPYYKYQKLPPQSAAAVQITTTGGNDSVFELPPKVFNLARSWLEFTLTPPQCVITGYNYMHLGALTPWQQVQVISKTTGKILLDISQFQMFTKVIFQAAISIKEYYNQDLGYDASLPNQYTGVVSFLRKNNSPFAAAANNVVLTTPGSFAIRPIDGSNPVVYYNEQSYCEIGQIGAAGPPIVPGNGPVFNCSIPMGLIKESILEVDKDLFFNDVLQIRFVWGSINRVGWQGTSNTNPVTGAIAMADPANITNLNLYLAVEQNEDIANEVKKTVMTQGLKIPIAYPTAVRNTITNNSQHTVTLLMNQTHGTRLMKIYHTMLAANGAVNPTEQLNVAYDMLMPTDATAAGSYFYCQLDSNRIEDQNINLNTYEDWMYINTKLKNSITFCSEIYRYNWFWIEDFSSVNANASASEDSEIKGIEMGNGRRFDFQLNAGGGAISAIHYDFIIGQKILTLTANGPYLQ